MEVSLHIVKEANLFKGHVKYTPKELNLQLITSGINISKILQNDVELNLPMKEKEVLNM